MTEAEKRESLGAPAYVVGLLSFIPLVGIPIALAVIVWGIVTKKSGGKYLVLLGVGGLAFTAFAYGMLFYLGFMQRGGVYDDMRAKLAQGVLDGLVPSIEMHRVQTGKYPETLKDLQATLPKNGFSTIYDPTVMGFTEPRLFYYQRVGDDHYYLRGLGADGEPFTADDLVPGTEIAPGSRIGLLKERRPIP